MSMQLTMKPYITVGVALVGASVIAVAPIAPRADLHMPAVTLAASIDNPISVFKPVVNAAGDLIRQTLQSEFADPFPILRQVFANQQFTVEKLLEAINGGGSALRDLVTGLPAALQAAGAILRTGNINGAIDSLVSSGLGPILGFISGVTVPLQEALERPFAVGQKLVAAGFETGLALTVALAQTFIGIGFPVGTTPVLQNLITVTESVLKSIGTLNPINIINAVQNGVADVLLNAVTHLNDFMTQSVPYIRDVIVNALKAGQPVSAPETTSVATAPAADAQTFTIAVPGVETDGGTTSVTPVSATDGAAEDTTTTEPAAEDPTAEDTAPADETGAATDTDEETDGDAKAAPESDATSDDVSDDKADDNADGKSDEKSDDKTDTTSDDKADNTSDDKADKADSSPKRDKADSRSSDSRSRAAA